MKQLVSRAIVLSRTDFGEADRIVTMLTPDHGKRRLMVRGARKLKSKLAGGIELFSISDITFIKGRGDIDTLISSRLIKHYASIVKDINRVQLGYDLIKQLNKATEDQPESDYFDLLNQGFAALDRPDVSLDLIRLWFQARLLNLSGHAPNLQTDVSGQKLSANLRYKFDYDNMALAPNQKGVFAADQIKFLRLIFSNQQPQALNQIKNLNDLLQVCGRLVNSTFQLHIKTF